MWVKWMSISLYSDICRKNSFSRYLYFSIQFQLDKIKCFPLSIGFCAHVLNAIKYCRGHEYGAVKRNEVSEVQTTWDFAGCDGSVVGRLTVAGYQRTMMVCNLNAHGASCVTCCGWKLIADNKSQKGDNGRLLERDLEINGASRQKEMIIKERTRITIE